MNQEPPTDSGVSKSTSQYSWVILVLVLCAVVIYFGFWATTPFNIAFKADAGFRRAKKNIETQNNCRFGPFKRFQSIHLRMTLNGYETFLNQKYPARCKIFTLFVQRLLF